MLYGEGISREGEILALGEKYEIIKKAGASYSYGDIKLGRGYDAARTFLKENTKERNALLKEINKSLV